jgi:hypothetical protein
MPPTGNVRAVGENTAQIRYAQRKEEFVLAVRFACAKPLLFLMRHHQVLG